MKGILQWLALFAGISAILIAAGAAIVGLEYLARHNPILWVIVILLIVSAIIATCAYNKFKRRIEW